MTNGCAWVAQGDHLARFVTDASKLTGSPSTRKSAFVPPADTLELSVFTTLHAECDDLRRAGQHVANGKVKPVHGALITPRATYDEQKKLRLVPGKPVFGASTHNNVVGWPLERRCQRTIASKLGKASKPLSLAAPIRPRFYRSLIWHLWLRHRRKLAKKKSTP